MKNPIATFQRKNEELSMKHIKSIVLLALALVASAALAQQEPPKGAGDQPQGQRRGMPSVDDQLKNLTDKLSLTADQQTKIKPILEDQSQQMQALMKDDSLSQDDRRAKGRSIRESTNTKIRDVLTDDQKKKYDEWQQEMRDRMRQRQGGDNPPPPK
jgi:periplasmic protein CpxP/Spy